MMSSPATEGWRGFRDPIFTITYWVTNTVASGDYARGRHPRRVSSGTATVPHAARAISLETESGAHREDVANYTRTGEKRDANGRTLGPVLQTNRIEGLAPDHVDGFRLHPDVGGNVNVVAIPEVNDIGGQS